MVAFGTLLPFDVIRITSVEGFDGGGSSWTRITDLRDVATYGPHDSGSEGQHHPEQDRDRDLRHVTSPVVSSTQFQGVDMSTKSR